MTEFFIKLVNMSISAGWLILAAVFLRFLLKKAPKTIALLLWAIVGVRLVLPISVESVFSLVPSAETISPAIIYDASPTIHSGIAVLNDAVNPVICRSFAPETGDSVNPLGVWIEIAAVVWMIGVIAMLVYAVISCIRLSRSMSEAVKYRGNIFMSERVDSPFIFGLIRPRIYIPYGLSESELTYIEAHEQAHISRRDHIIKLIGFLVLALHWFNLLVWLAYILLCRDIELACDERVIRGLDREQRAEYSETLLLCSSKRHNTAACPLAFGEVGVRERVKNVLSYKKPALWLMILAVVLCIAAAVCFLTDPVSDEDQTIDGNTYVLFNASENMIVYVFDESEDVMKPCVALRENGQFSFTFSAISSYIGVGEYEMTDDRLILRTDDGQFVYTFDIAGDTIVFDAENSSDVTWFSGLYDGAVMKRQIYAWAELN